MNLFHIKENIIQAIDNSSRISGMMKEFMLFEVLGLSSGDVNDSSFFLKKIFV